MALDILPTEFALRLAAIKDAVEHRVRPLQAPYPAVTLIFSVSDGPKRALTLHRSGASFAQAWQAATTALATEMQRHGLAGRDLRLDWVENAESWTWALLRQRLRDVKRNYSRRGMALDTGFKLLFTEQEINARAMFYGGNRDPFCVVNEKNISLAVTQKFGNTHLLTYGNTAPVHMLDTLGVYCGPDGVVHELHGRGRDAGRRKTPVLDGPLLDGIIGQSAGFLADQVGRDGKFVYGYHPCFDREIPAYNALRHASTTYAMLEAWEHRPEARLLQQIEAALSYLCSHFLHKRDECAYIVDVGQEVKLGANATAILAMAKYTALFGGTRFLGEMQALAAGILRMQAADGSFTHVLTWPDLAVKEAFRIVYYEGEAAFALMRLYHLDPDPRWLGAVELAFDHFIAKEYWRHHDHWLSYCTNELTIYRPALRYFEFGVRNFEGYLDFVRERITTFPTLLELMMAGRKMLDRMATLPEAAALLARVDQTAFDHALHTRAHHLLNGHFWPEFAMFMRHPDRIRGAFFIRHHGFRVRIDDVEHYLSALVAYARYYTAADAAPVLVPRSAGTAKGWDAQNLQLATGGTWLTPVPVDWQATGVATYAPAAQAGNLLVIRDGAVKIGITPQTARQIAGASGAIIGPDSDFTAQRLPLLKVGDTTRALHGMAIHARQSMAARVVGITGSSGKTTTTALISHVLACIGKVASSRENANLPTGVAWNIASMPWDADYAVLEMAVGQMRTSSTLARPDVAVFTNILPAHLGVSSTTEDIARTKSLIFYGMQAGAHAVLNRDMEHFDMVREAAEAKGLQIITYGASGPVDVEILTYDAATATARLRVADDETSLTLSAPGLHMAYNAAAVGAVLLALGRYSPQTLQSAASFKALEGRGEVLALASPRGTFTLIDEAYNANPGSMSAALRQLAARAGRRRIAVLGQMEDLGEAADSYHDELLADLTCGGIERVFLIGPRYAKLWATLPTDLKGGYLDDLHALRRAIMKEATAGDVFMVKGSHSTEMHRVVAWMKRLYGADKRQP